MDFDLDSFDLHTFDPVPRRRRATHPAPVVAPTKIAAPTAEPKPEKAKAPNPELMEALLAEVAERRTGMAELERGTHALSHEMRRIKDQVSPAPTIRFAPAAGFGRPMV